MALLIQERPSQCKEGQQKRQQGRTSAGVQKPLKEKMPIESPLVPIVTEHEDFLLVHKPPDWAVTRDGEEKGLVARLRQQTGHATLIPVHRLDKVTSGLWLLAKNARTAAALSSLFRLRQVRKCYVALADRKPHKKQGVIIGDMVRSRNGQWKMCLSRSAPAITRFISRSMAPGLRLFALFPETGKTHQVRVAMKCLGAPVLGDPLYGTESRGPFAPDRTYLHAYALAFQFQGMRYFFQERPRHGSLFLSEPFARGVESFEALERELLAWRRP